MFLKFTEQSESFIRKLNPEVKTGIKSILDDLAKNPYLGKPLQKELSDYWTLAYKNYRAIYKYFLDRKTIVIFFLEKRSHVYEKFTEVVKNEMLQ